MKVGGSSDVSGLLIAIAVLNLPFLIAALILTPSALPSLAAFLSFSILYSAPPVRAKAAPILDSIFNILYVFPERSPIKC